MSVPSTQTTTAPFPWIGLLTLAGAIFVSVTSEFLPTGLLPDMARDLDVRLSTAGYLVTVFAGTVVVATTPLAALTRRYSRKKLVIVVLLVIATANVLAAIAPSYAFLVGARILGGLAHGLFWAVVAAYSAHLVPKHQLGRAVAITAGGGSAAFVLGVPVGTALGHWLGWRVAFIIIAVVVVVLVLAVAKFLPPVDHHVPLATGEIALPMRKDPTLAGVIIVCVVILIVLTGQNTFYTYIAPWLTDVAGFESGSIAGLLFLFGGAGVVGLFLAGFAADRFPERGFAVGILAVMASVLALALASGTTAAVLVAFVVWGIAFGGVPAMLQTRLLRTASPRARDLAAALQTTAFNVGIGGGALLGGLLLDGVGLEALPYVEIAFLVVGLSVSVIGYALFARRSRRRLA
ncbi:putative MFS family arabinose efflux permease [Glaciihabitans tibetensis]|uniref:Putative MFS family arabinose efflux permease n=1 Tax=Glaciihabitans tibetensis TaxID=1266600 RepID=A0A2T0VCG3_9MICO|nr:MFS transporter [Glaciihabitans tibetensis]PRY67861.1 putative MFS family arabinose efflux permease [Glaciihabitans tibetensis]